MRTNFHQYPIVRIDKVPEVGKLYKEEERYRELLDFAIQLEGLSRHSGVHAAGVVIAPGPRDEYVPVCTQGSKGSGAGSDDNIVVTQYDMNALEKVGMLKMDFLGLTTLTIIKDTLASIKARTGTAPDLDTLLGAGATRWLATRMKWKLAKR